MSETGELYALVTELNQSVEWLVTEIEEQEKRIQKLEVFIQRIKQTHSY